MSKISLRLILSVLLKPSAPNLKEETASPEEPLPRTKPQRVFHISKVPLWMQWDPYISYGYRTQLNSFRECFRSLFYVHNESVNIWSHTLPGLYFLALLLAIDYWALELPFQAPLPDIIAIQSYVAATAGCLFFSVSLYVNFIIALRSILLILQAVFHTTSAHSPEVATAFLKLDYLGIILSISATCISTAYFALHSDPTFQFVYISLTALCAVIVFWITLDPRMDGANAGFWRKAIPSLVISGRELTSYRATVFFVLAASGLAPILHVAFAEGSAGFLRIPVGNIVLTCTSYAVGTTIYVIRFPEKYWMDRFDLFVR